MSAFIALPSTTAAGLLETRNTLYPPPPPRGQKRACSRRLARRSRAAPGALRAGPGRGCCSANPVSAGAERCGALLSPTAQRGFQSALTPAQSQVELRSLGLAFGKGEGEARCERGKPRLQLRSAPRHTASSPPRRASEQPFPGKAGLPPIPARPPRTGQRPSCCRSQPPAEGPLRQPCPGR